MCYDLRELKLHMQRKTAWSNRALVGCRVSVLLDNRDWQVAHKDSAGRRSAFSNTKSPASLWGGESSTRS
jgi:hypothetical protein